MEDENMPNIYSYEGDEAVRFRVGPDQTGMKRYDLNNAALDTFITAIRTGDLEKLKTQFNILYHHQKRGLLNTFIDHESKNYYSTSVTFMNLPSWYGTDSTFANPIRAVKKLGHLLIEGYLIEQQNYLDNFERSYPENATAGALSQGSESKKIPEEVGRYTGTFLNKKDSGRVAQTCKAAANTVGKPQSEFKPFK